MQGFAIVFGSKIEKEKLVLQMKVQVANFLGN